MGQGKQEEKVRTEFREDKLLRIEENVNTKNQNLQLGWLHPCSHWQRRRRQQELVQRPCRQLAITKDVDH
jgi:hypothetical protein